MAVEQLDALALSVRAQYDPRTAPLVGLNPNEKADIRIKALMARANRFRVEAFKGEQHVATIVGDGRMMAEWDVQENRWTEYPQFSNRKYLTGLRLIGGDSPSSVALLIARFAQCWVDPDGPYGARIAGLLDHPGLRVGPAQTLEGRSCYVLTANKKSSGGILSGTEETTLAFDHTTDLPVLEQICTSVSALLLPALDVTQRFVYERVEANPTLAADAFQFEAPPDSEFVDPEQLLPSEDSELVGKPVPSAQFHTLDGRTVDLAEHRGEKAVLLVFWATWCAPCKQELKDLEVLHSDQELVGKVQIVVVSTDRSPGTVRSFLQRHALPFSTLHDAADQASELFGVQGIPRTFVIDRQGTVLGAWTGWSAPGLRLQAIRETLRRATVVE